jgi:hypothetical protein
MDKTGICLMDVLLLVVGTLLLGPVGFILALLLVGNTK